MKIRFPASLVGRSALLLLILSLSIQCSVLEDRTDCPCLLDIDLTDCSNVGNVLMLKGWVDGEMVFGNRVLENDFQAPFEVEVPRGKVSYCACSCVEHLHQTGMLAYVPKDSIASPVMAYLTTVKTDGDTAFDKVKLHKQYSDIHLIFKEMNDSILVPSSVYVSGLWSGLDLSSLEPLEEEFSFRAVEDSEGGFFVRVLRQGDDSLTLYVDVDGSNPEIFDLGRLIKEVGYDWKAEDLDDIWIEMDWAKCDWNLTIEEWRGSDVLEERL